MTSPPRIGPTLAALWLLTFASTSQTLIVSPILPAIREQLYVPPAWGGALIAVYGASAMVFALIAGPVSDYYGRRAVLLAGTLGMALALWGHGLAPNFPALLLARAAAGAAGGILGGAAVAYVADAFPYERRGWANGWVMSGFALGQVLGIPLGTVLAERWGFRAPFVGLAAVMSAAMALVYFAVPQPPVSRAPTLAFGDAWRGYGALLRRRDTGATVLSYLTTFAGVALHIAYFPTWLEETFRVSGDHVALMFVVGGVGAVITNPVAGRLSDRYGRKPLILLACVLFATLTAATPYVITSFSLAYPVFFATMVATSLRVPPIQSLVGALVPAEERGSLLSLSSAMGQGGFAIGGALAGALWPWGFPACTWTAAAFVGFTALLVARAVPEPSAATAR